MAIKQFSVTQNGKPFDVVMYPPEYTADRVKRSLIGFDGYPDDIEVEEQTDDKSPKNTLPDEPTEFKPGELAAAAAAIEAHYQIDIPRFNVDPDGPFKRAKIEARNALGRQFAAVDTMTAATFYQLTGRNKRAGKQH